MSPRESKQANAEECETLPRTNDPLFPPNGIKQKAKDCQRIKETKETQMNSLNGSLDFEKNNCKKDDLGAMGVFDYGLGIFLY